MKIKELIEKLQEYDENMEVVVYDWEEHTYDNAFTFEKEVWAYKEEWGKRKWINIYSTMERAEKRTEWVEWVKYDDILVIYADY